MYNIKITWDIKCPFCIFLIFPTLPSHLNMSSSVESSHYFVSQLFIDRIWLIVTDKISEGKSNMAAFFFSSFMERGLSLRKAMGNGWRVVNSLLLAPSQTPMIWWLWLQWKFMNLKTVYNIILTHLLTT